MRRGQCFCAEEKDNRSQKKWAIVPLSETSGALLEAVLTDVEPERKDTWNTSPATAGWVGGNSTGSNDSCVVRQLCQTVKRTSYTGLGSMGGLATTCVSPSDWDTTVALRIMMTARVSSWASWRRFVWSGQAGMAWVGRARAERRLSISKISTDAENWRERLEACRHRI